MAAVGVYIMPVVIGFILIFGLVKRVNVFDEFLIGAKEGMKSTASIAPALIGLVISVTMLRASGALDLFVNFLSPLANSLGFPAQVLPLMLLRPISGSGSIAVVDSIFKTCGVDSFAGRVASVMSGSTETTFYAIAVYYGSVGIRKTRHTIPAALSADIVGFIISVLSVNILFNL